MLRDKIHELANIRKEEEQKLEEINKLQVELEQISIFMKLEKEKEILFQLRTEAGQCEDEVRKLAIAEWIKTSEKKMPGVTIGIYEKLTYEDEDAIKFSMAQDYVKGLKLNKSEFKGLAKVMQPSFVQFSKEPRANIKKNLTEFL